MPQPREDELFERALALPAADRAAWLEQACANNAALRAQINALLRAHVDASEFMEAPPVDLTGSGGLCDVVTEEKPGDRIGRYKLLQKIGEGGCGVVYMAEQEEAVRRRVALKVIKLGMDTKAVIARFEAERQALARMEHPNIARVLDAGATSSGRPFFVMELVRGLRITEYCDQNNLSTEHRLELFIKVCQAIQHAHQKGVIHRDIKPSNVLVTLHDGAPVPKVIDFGIAKATQGRLTEQTLFTAFEQFIGTPAYVAPEQAEMSMLDVDTRSDIYSLGVLLYELLTGRTPFDTQELVRSGIDEMRRRIREQEPPRPSLRLRTLNDSDRTTVAKRRGTDAPRLTVRLRGDIDWIVMRCLEKDRGRRYETANGLAMDIQRHLQNEPVTARPPSTAYLLQKMVRRHRFAFAAGAAILAALAAGFAVSTALYLHARKEQVRAEEGVVRRTKLALMITEAMKDIGLHVSIEGGDRRVLDDLIAQTSALKKEFADQPQTEAALGEALAFAYFRTGDFAQAEKLFLEAYKLRKQTVGKNAREIAQTLASLGMVYSAQFRWADAEKCYTEALELQQDPAVFGPLHLEVSRTQRARGWALARQRKLPDAERFLLLAAQQQRTLHAGPDLAITLMRLGSVFTQQDRILEAEEVLREALEINRREFGPESLQTASSMSFLAVTIALTQSRLPDAIQLYREAFATRQRLNNAPAAKRGTTPPPSDTAAKRAPITAARAPGTTDALDSILTPDAMAEVDAALRDAQLYALQTYGPDSWEQAFYHALRVWVLLQERKFEEAKQVAETCLAIREKLGPNDWSTHHARHMLGFALFGLGEAGKAEALLVRGYKGMKEEWANIPYFHKSRLGEAAKRIIEFYTAAGRADQVTEWRAEFNGLPEDARQVLLMTPTK